MDLKGLYKISDALLYRMIAKRVVSKDGISYNGASRLEILSILYLTHIADSRGHVEGFRVQEFMSKTGCSRRKAFDLMHTLCDKGYIRVHGSDWAYCHDIDLLYSDFSDFDKSMRYIDTNMPLFEQGRSLFDAFSGLSLYSMRLMLYIVRNYSMDYGYHASFSSVMAALGIKHRSVLMHCLDELQDTFGFLDEFVRIRSDLKTGVRYGYMDLLKSLDFLSRNQGISVSQDSYYKRRVEHIADDTGAVLSPDKVRRGSILNRIFYECQSALEKFSLSVIEDCLRSVFLQDGFVDELTVRHLKEALC